MMPIFDNLFSDTYLLSAYLVTIDVYSTDQLHNLNM